MEVKVKIDTPPGSAQTYTETEKINFGNFEKKAIRKLLLGKLKVKEEYTNKERSEVYWLLELTPKQYIDFTKKTMYFDVIIDQFINNKAAQKTMKWLAKKPEDVDKVKNMLKVTRVEIIKEATAKELDGYGKTWWQRIKEKMVKTPQPNNDND